MDRKRELQNIDGCVSTLLISIMLLFMDDQRTLEKSGEIKRGQSLKARSKEVLTN